MCCAAGDSVQAIVPEEAIKEKDEIQHGGGSAHKNAPAGARDTQGM